MLAGRIFQIVSSRNMHLRLPLFQPAALSSAF